MAGAAVATAVARPRNRAYSGYVDSVPVVVSPAPFMPVAAVVAPVPQQAPPLGVASVRLPADAIGRSGSVVFFSIDVYPENGGAPWRVQHRYNHFSDLADRLGSQARSMLSAPFPRKHLTGCEGTKLENRRAALEAWLSMVIQWANSYDHAWWRQPLREFLQVPAAGAAGPVLGTALPNRAAPPSSAPIVGSPTASIGSALPNRVGSALPPASSPTASIGPAAAPLPPLPPPSEPAPVPSTAPEASEGFAMEIEVPAGVSAGQHIGVTVPSGEQLLLKVPDGVVAGQTLSLWYERGALQPML